MMNAHAESRAVAPLNVGGHVGAIIPQSVEEMWRVGTMVVRAGLAPHALVDKKGHEDAVSAVCTAIMAGAELGLPPMVALRSFTVIGGRPALYGDGLINVARRSRRAKRVQTGFSVSNFDKMAAAGKVENTDEGRKAFASMSADEKAIGWCVAERSDTGETRTEVFSIADAKRASLWDDREKVRRKGRNGDWYDAANDAPWHRYPQRMLAWRAAGYCLRELFADVLGGITDEFEAREISGIDAEYEVIETPAPPSPPSPPAVPPAPAEESVEHGLFDAVDFLDELETQMSAARTEADIGEVWSELDVEAMLEGDDDNREIAEKVKARHLQRVLVAAHPLAAG